MDRKTCDGCGKEINGYFTKIIVKKLVYDGQSEMDGAVLAGEHLVKEYDMCDECTPAMIVTLKRKTFNKILTALKGVEL